jgi:hypothetical protein
VSHGERAVPAAEYRLRKERRQEEVVREGNRERTIAYVRVVVAAVGAVVLWLAFGAGRVEPWWVAAPATLFLLLVILHDRVIGRRRRAERAVAFYERGLARIEDRWIGTGEAGGRFIDAQHPYAQDLDLFGPGSMFELLCTARTRAGEETLAGWLRSPSGREAVAERHDAVTELKPRLDLREDLALLGDDLRSSVDTDGLVEWGRRAPVLRSQAARVVALVLVAATLAALAALAMGAGPLFLFPALLLQGSFALAFRNRVRSVVQAVNRPAHDLALLADVMERLERESFRSPRLTVLKRELERHGRSPARQIRRLHRLVELLQSRENQFFAPFAALLLWATQLAFGIERWRLESGPLITRWIEAAGELEALLALASYASENPQDVLPELVDDGPLLDAEEMGHPLIPLDRGVRNSVELGRARRLLIVSGSNMSGKSTFLRTVGVNVVLALMGAPVRARRLRLTPLMAGATLRIQDSLHEGRSRFYAEISRIRRLLDLTDDGIPVLFLLDELLHGTNSHDRKLGAEAIIGSLLRRGAVGLVTTHDLALTGIAERLGRQALNGHFEDWLQDGRMVFDYRIRPGVVTKSNALARMRAVGLDV